MLIAMTSSCSRASLLMTPQLPSRLPSFTRTISYVSPRLPKNSRVWRTTSPTVASLLYTGMTTLNLVTTLRRNVARLSKCQPGGLNDPCKILHMPLVVRSTAHVGQDALHVRPCIRMKRSTCRLQRVEPERRGHVTESGSNPPVAELPG